MDLTASIEEKRAQSDRRFLPRTDNGKRELDRAERELVTEESAAHLGAGESGAKYILLMAMVFVIGLTGIYSANTYLAPVLNDDKKVEVVGEILASGKN